MSELKQRIILIRHGESVANKDHTIYGTTPDHLIELTPHGYSQAQASGLELKRIVNDEPLHIFVSPHLRAKQTLKGLLEAIPESMVRIFEDPRIREQEWGMLHDPNERTSQKNYYLKYGTFFYRFDQGESGADVYDRVTGIVDTIWRDMRKPNPPQNFVLVCHGLSIQLFLMRWFHLTTKIFEVLGHPANGQIVTLERPLGSNDKFTIKNLPVPHIKLAAEHLQPPVWTKAKNITI